MAWIYLLLAGLCEIGFALSLKRMDGHRHLGWSVAFYVFLVVSFALLQQAVKTIPVGTAYAIWTGIGGVGVATVGILFLGESANVWRLLCLVLIVGGLVGLKLTSSH